VQVYVMQNIGAPVADSNKLCGRPPQYALAPSKCDEETPSGHSSKCRHFSSVQCQCHDNYCCFFFTW